jgi:hypothetical protein
MFHEISERERWSHGAGSYSMKSIYSNKIFFLLCGIFIAFLFILDLVLGYLDVKPMKKIYTTIRTCHPYYHHDLKPCMSSFYDEIGSGYGYPLTTNSLGFKDTSTRRVPLKVDKKRILFMGDSFTEGIFVPYESTFAGQIAGHRPDMDILNAGVSSYSPLIYYLKVDYLLNKAGLKFDELFVFIDMSDIKDEYVYNDVEHFTPATEKSYSNNFRFKAETFFYHHSYAYNLFRQMIENQQENTDGIMWTLSQPVFDKYNLNIREENVNIWAQKGIAHAQDHMQKLVNLCKKNNIPMTIVVYPYDIQITVRDMPSKQERIWNSFAQKNGIGFLDLFPVFINHSFPETIIGKYFFPGDPHWNAAGHALVANQVLAFMREKERKDRE